MENISGFGTKVTIVAIQSFPQGFSLSKFADDKDPVAIDDIEPIGYQMLYDGGLFAFDKAVPVTVSVSVIPNTDDDINLKILLQTKKGGFRYLPIEDLVSMIISYPNGGTAILTNGTIISGPPADSITQAGRRQSNTYKFAFATFAGAQSGQQIAAGIAQNILSIL